MCACVSHLENIYFIYLFVYLFLCFVCLFGLFILRGGVVATNNQASQNEIQWSPAHVYTTLV